MSIERIQEIAAASSTAGSIRKQVDQFIDRVTLFAQNGLTLSEVGQIITAFVAMAVSAAEGLADAEGEEKKEMVLDFVDQLYDVVAPYVPLPMFLSPFRRFLREPLRYAVLAIAEGMLEVFVERLPANRPDVVKLPAA
jgi:hypothetical protein